jgi:GNAT superfamily N-acetyltransferase
VDGTADRPRDGRGAAPGAEGADGGPGNHSEVCRLDNADRRVAAAIRDVMALAYRVEAGMIEVDDFLPLHRTAEQIAGAGTMFFGVDVGGTLAAVVELEDEGSDRRCTCSLATRPDRFREGLATLLLQHLIEVVGSVELTVSTAVRNEPALRLYGAEGFRERSRWTTPDGIPMVTLVRAADG